MTGLDHDGNLHVRGRAGDRVLPAPYVREHVELAYATTVHGAQGETVRTAHLLVGETTGAAAAYVGMTRGRDRNVAHLVADNLDDARSQWIEVFNRDRADLGPAHAARLAADDIDRYGPRARPRRAPTGTAALQAAALRGPGPRRPGDPIPGPRSAPDRGSASASEVALGEPPPVNFGVSVRSGARAVALPCTRSRTNGTNPADDTMRTKLIDELSGDARDLRKHRVPPPNPTRRRYGSR